MKLAKNFVSNHNKAIINLQGYFRMIICKRRLHAYKCAACIIQRCTRMFLAFKKFSVTLKQSLKFKRHIVGIKRVQNLESRKSVQ